MNELSTFEGVHEPHVGLLEGSASVVEGIGGLAGVVLAILGLAGLLPLEFAAIAAIALGVTLVAEGGAIASRFARSVSRTLGGETEIADLGGGMSSELLGGVAAGVLGLLAVLHIAALQLVPVAALVLGAAVLLGSAASSRINGLTLAHATRREVEPVVRETILAATGAQVMVAIGAVTLGIIAVVGVNPVVLSLVAFLALGTALVLGGTAIGGTMIAALRR